MPLGAALGLAIVRAAHHKDPWVGVEVAEKIADRLEGRPVQTVTAQQPRDIIVYRDGDPVPAPLLKPSERRAQEASAEEKADADSVHLSK